MSGALTRHDEMNGDVYRGQPCPQRVLTDKAVRRYVSFHRSRHKLALARNDEKEM